MAKLTRRGFLAASGAAVGARAVPVLMRPRMRAVVELVRGPGGLRAVERWLPF